MSDKTWGDWRIVSALNDESFWIDYNGEMFVVDIDDAAKLAVTVRDDMQATIDAQAKKIATLQAATQGAMVPSEVFEGLYYAVVLSLQSLKRVAGTEGAQGLEIAEREAPRMIAAKKWLEEMKGSQC